MTPDWVTWNGYAGQYVKHPLTAHPGHRARFYVVDAGPSLNTDFHIVGTVLKRAWVDAGVTDTPRARRADGHRPGRRRRGLRREDRQARPLSLRQPLLRERRHGRGRPAERRRRQGDDEPLDLDAHAASSSASRSGARPAASVVLRGVERPANRLLERAERQAGGDCARDTSVSCIRPSLRRPDPERQLHPLADAVLEQELVGTQTKRASPPATSRHVSSSSPHATPAVRRVERPAVRVSHEPTIQSPRSRTSINCTCRSGGAGREHVAAARDPVRPVREAAGRIVRPDDQARAHDRPTRSPKAARRRPPRRAP